jgi:integrase
MGYVNSKRYDGVQLYKKSNGDVTYSIRYKDENEKLVRLKIGNKSQGITEQYCNQKRTEVINKIRLGEDPIIKQKKRKSFTFENAYNEYIIWSKGNKKSWTKDENLYKNHLQSLNGKAVVDLKPADFEAIKQEKLKTLSVRTVEYILAVARQIINHAIKNELVKNYTNPISGGRVKIPKPDNAKVGFLSKQQARELLDILRESESKTKYYLTVILLYTGARFSEVASLTWHDINFTDRLIYLF